MKYQLAESVLKSTMSHWDLSKMIEETNNIQIISEIKYDDYQQFTHGMRYIESLALWMRQFESKEDREIVYDMIKNQLIYVSEEEMRQLVAYTYPLIIKKYLMCKTKDFCEQFSICDPSERRQVYDFYQRCSLFLGLSDGAHIDYFRRQNSTLSNEQVFVHYDFSDAKAEDMKKELEKEGQIIETATHFAGHLSAEFTSCFLIDDFTGSGKSYIRKDADGWHGKISKFINRLKEIKFDYKEMEIHLILYVATETALDHIRERVDEYVKEEGIKSITLDAIQIVKPLDWTENAELSELLKRNYENFKRLGYRSYVDRHFQKGGGGYPYYGFSDCSLPLILYHNTPNNSLPVLWYSWEDQINALFPRITRHKES